MLSIAHLHIVEDAMPLKWSQINFAGKILFPSEDTMRDVLSNAKWINKKKYRFVHNSVDTKVCFPKDVYRLKEVLLWRKDSPVVSIVGQVKKIKGQYLFLKLSL